MLKASRLLEAAESLRRGTPAEVIARTEAYANLARAELDRIRALLPRFDALVAIAARSTAQPLRLPRRQTFVGPWAELSNVVTEGDDWEYDDDSYEICTGTIPSCPFLLNIVSAATRARAHVRAGFDSSVTWDRAHLLAFDVPANAGRVQVDIDASHVDLEVETEQCFGHADGRASHHYSIYEVGGDGVVDPFNDPVVTGLFWNEWYDEDDVGVAA